tara:strand:- start:335 stop:526 length:192 start_codon:yes stop_codon:yes gene_type:complete
MWLAIVMFCMTPMDARTCTLMVHNDNLFMKEQECRNEMRDMVDTIFARGIFAQGTCVTVGVGT